MERPGVTDSTEAKIGEGLLESPTKRELASTDNETSALFFRDPPVPKVSHVRASPASNRGPDNGTETTTPPLTRYYSPGRFSCAALCTIRRSTGWIHLEGRQLYAAPVFKAGLLIRSVHLLSSFLVPRSSSSSSSSPRRTFRSRDSRRRDS